MHINIYAYTQTRRTAKGQTNRETDTPTEMKGQKTQREETHLKMAETRQDRPSDRHSNGDSPSMNILVLLNHLESQIKIDWGH